MGNFDSPLGKTQFQGKESRQFTVSDETEGAPEQHQRVQNFAASRGVVPEYNPQIHERFDPEKELSSEPSPGVYSSKNHSAEEVMAFREKLMNQRVNQAHQNDINDRRKLEVLLGIGRMYRDVPVQVGDGRIVFRIQTLKSKERQHVAQALDNLLKLKNNDALHSVRNVILSYCINSADGIPIDTILQSTNVPDSDRFLIRESFVKELDDNLSLLLFKNFEALDDEAKSRFSLTTEEGVKEVAEAIKKSE